MRDIDVIGIRESILALNKVDKQIVKDLRLDLQQITAPLINQIRGFLPTSAPIRGFDHNGRTAWPKKPISIKTQLNSGISRRGLRRSTVRIVISNAGVEIADMAGRRNKIGKGYSRAYVKSGGKSIMRHRLNGQGRYMIQALNFTGYGKASRYVWPTVEKYKGTITMEIEKTIAEAIINGNRELQRRIA